MVTATSRKPRRGTSNDVNEKSALRERQRKADDGEGSGRRLIKMDGYLYAQASTVANEGELLDMMKKKDE